MCKRVGALRFRQVEFRLVALVNGQRYPLRLVSSNPTGYVLRVDFYVEHGESPATVPKLTSIAGASRLVDA
jgi:hypothetical protein